MRQAMLAGVAMSLCLTVLNTLQAPPGGRWANFMLTAGACAVMVTSVFVTARTVRVRRDG